MQPYLLKRKDEIIGLIQLNAESQIEDYKLLSNDNPIDPLHNPSDKEWLKKWWKRRAVPISQGHIRQMLEKKGLIGPEEYLAKNLGLSLTDYYWIAPIDSGMNWKDVNLFENEFHDDINIASDESDSSSTIPHYTPNGSLQGTLEKCWTIRNGKRGMLKGNRDSFSAESFNEIIATKLHELQGFNNYTEYKLLELHNREYEYGCFCGLFTSSTLELVSAYDVIESEKKRPDTNTYEHLIQVCANHGLDEDILRPFLEYQIMTDFILSGRDRHLSNISILRDAQTLKFVKPAPIYDSGKSMFVYDMVPDNTRDLLKIPTESFASTELGLLKLVKDRSLVDITKLPDPSFIESLYSYDSHMTESRIRSIIQGYEQKIDLFSQWQKGKNLKTLIYPAVKKNKTQDLSDLFV